MWKITDTDPMYAISDTMTRNDVRALGIDAIQHYMHASDYVQLIQDAINHNPKTYQLIHQSRRRHGGRNPTQN